MLDLGSATGMVPRGMDPVFEMHDLVHHGLGSENGIPLGKVFEMHDPADHELGSEAVEIPLGKSNAGDYQQAGLSVLDGLGGASDYRGVRDEWARWWPCSSWGSGWLDQFPS